MTQLMQKISEDDAGFRMIAIHHRPGSFSDQWIAYCDAHSIPYRLVDCYRSDIIQQLEGCSGLMWHWAHNDHKAALFARQLTLSLERVGIRVFPDVATGWHYDDKLGQKYLLEAAGIPLVPSYLFYDREEALRWAEQTTYPKVFKLRGGAGSENVKLVRDVGHARRLIRRSFGRGRNLKSRTYLLKERLWHIRRDRTLRSLWNLGRGLARLVIPTEYERAGRIEKHYAYFQDFIPGNDHDIRVIVIGHRAFALKRMTREGDFRASGSGNIIYDKDAIPEACVKLAFAVTKKLAAQCLAYDFVFLDDTPLVVEISYGFASAAYWDCPGFWDDSLRWHAERFRPQHFMIEDFVRTVTNSVPFRTVPDLVTHQ